MSWLRILTLPDRMRWRTTSEAMGGIVTSELLGDPFDQSGGVLLVDGAVLMSATQIGRWVSQATPEAVIVMLEGSDKELLQILGEHYPLKPMIRAICAERYGSPVIWHRSVAVFGHVMSTPPPYTHGPGVVDGHGRPVFWNEDVYAGLGIPVCRDETLVLQSLHRSWAGNQSMWFQPGFPGLIPAAPAAYPALDGSGMVFGVLCASMSRPGGWCVLQLSDLCELLGIPPKLRPSISWQQLADWIPPAGAQALIRWALSFQSSGIEPDQPAFAGHL